MKKILFVLLAALLCLSGCGGHYDYSQHISEVKSDIFCAETEEFTLTAACVSREYPYCADGIACPMSNVIEISLVPAERQNTEYFVYIGEIGGEMSVRNAQGDYFYSESIDVFPEGSVSVIVEWGEERREIAITSVKNEKTISVGDALSYAVEAEKETISRMTKGGVFLGEFHIRLLRRDKNYYYVGIVDRDGETVSLLLDSESGSVLARRDTRV